MASVRESLFDKAKMKLGRWIDHDLDCLNDGKAILYYMGLWHNDHQIEPKAIILLAMLGKAVFVVSFFNTVLGYPVLAYQNLGVDLNVTINSIVATILGGIFGACMYCLIYHNTELEQVFSAMETMKECGAQAPERPEGDLKRIRKINRWIAVLMLGTTFVLTLIFLLLPVMYVQRKFPYEVWYPFDAKAPLVFELVLLSTSFAHMQAIGSTVLIVGMFTAFLLEAVAQFRVLALNLQSIGRLQAPMEDREGSVEAIEENMARCKESEDLLRLCVKHHNSIIRFIRCAESTYSKITLTFVLAALVPNGLGTAQLMIMKEVNVKTLTHVILLIVGNIVAALLFWIANIVTTENEAIRLAVFDCEWFDQSESFKRSMRIIMSRCNQPLVVMGGGFVSLSLEMYANIPQVSYTFCMATWAFIKDSDV